MPGFSLQSGYTAMEYLLKHCRILRQMFCHVEPDGPGRNPCPGPWPACAAGYLGFGYDGIALGHYSNPRLTVRHSHVYLGLVAQPAILRANAADEANSIECATKTTHQQVC